MDTSISLSGNTIVPNLPSSSPTISFTVPSLHDGTDLECRIYHTNSKLSRRGAIIAHPYAPLGGSYDDGVVQSLVSVFVAEGFTVGVFNFRGAGCSKARTSWSGKPELADYITFIGYFTLYLKTARDILSSRSGQPAPEGPKKILDIVLSGYSYGASVVMHLPPISEVLERFHSEADAPTRLAITRLASQHCLQKPIKPKATEGKRQSNGEDLSLAARHAQHDQVSISQTCYLLVCPLLPPVSWALAITNPFHKELHTDECLVVCPTLAVYSDNDQFTSVSRLRKWSAKLEGATGSKFRKSEIHGAGHFWLNEGALDTLNGTVREWLRTRFSDS